MEANAISLCVLIGLFVVFVIFAIVGFKKSNDTLFYTAAWFAVVADIVIMKIGIRDQLWYIWVPSILVVFLCILFILVYYSDTSEKTESNEEETEDGESDYEDGEW